jgi:hypothetical protein
MEKLNVTRILAAEDDGLDRRWYTCELEDGSTVELAGNPLTWGYAESKYNSVTKAVHNAWYLECLREARKNPSIGNEIRAYFGIRDEHHPEPYSW